MNYEELQIHAAKQWEQQDQVVLERILDGKLQALERELSEKGVEIPSDEIKEWGMKYAKILAMQAHARLYVRNAKDELADNIMPNIEIRFKNLNISAQAALPIYFAKSVGLAIETVRQGFEELYNATNLNIRIPRQSTAGEHIDYTTGIGRRQF